jgi:glycosyltransferase involved in cell wall biosynthesis
VKLLFGIKSMDVPGGGAERVLSIVASGLAARGHDVTIVTFDRAGGESFYALDPRIHRVCLGIGPTSGQTGPMAFARRLPALRHVVRKLRPDVVVGFMHSMFVPLGFAMVGTGIPLVASEHIVPEYYRGRGVEFWLFKTGCRLSKRVTVLSRAVRAMYPRGLQKKMVAMSNPVVEYPDCEVDPAGDSVSEKTVLSVGRLEHQKNHATLIEAFATIAGRFPQWRVRIVGDGSLRGSLEATVSRLGLGERVSLPGSTDRIENEYHRAQLLAVPSRFESFGMVTAEAMGVGLPVLGFSDCPGTNELINHNENGWLVTPKDEKDRVVVYAEGLSTLVGDSELRQRLGDAARRSIKGFDSQGVIDNWQALLKDVSGGVS